MKQFYGIAYTGLLFPWDDPEIYRDTMRSLPLEGFELRKWNGRYDNSHLAGKRLVGDGHSLGGQAVLELAESGLEFEILLLRDPVRRNWSQAPARKPITARLAICFHRFVTDHPQIPPPFGFADPALNIYRNLGHAEFITDPTINIWERAAVTLLEAAQ